MTNTCFTHFKTAGVASLIPEVFNDPFDEQIPEICKIAARELQAYLQSDELLDNRNFGLGDDDFAAGKGKMFGVLVVRNAENEIGYLSTFSGKLSSEADLSVFVPSVFDLASNDHFLTKGMTDLTQMGHKIAQLEKDRLKGFETEVSSLKAERKAKSIDIQQELFGQYHFMNKAGKWKSLFEIFDDFGGRKPASGAGECAAPKLLQYAYTNKMKPLAIAEFWWGKSNKSEDRKHGEFYPSCNDKCRPILGYMLGKVNPNF